VALILGSGGISRVSKGAVVNDVDVNKGIVWRIAFDQLKEQGTITNKDKERGEVTALIDGRTVKVKVKSRGSKISFYSIEAKNKNNISDFDLAYELSYKIYRRAKNNLLSPLY